MISKASPIFWKCFLDLPTGVRNKAKETYKIFQEDPWYPSLNFKRVHSRMPIYSVRISIDYRAVGILKDDRILWFWIGSHAEYDKLLNQLRKAQQ